MLKTKNDDSAKWIKLNWPLDSNLSTNIMEKLRKIGSNVTMIGFPPTFVSEKAIKVGDMAIVGIQLNRFFGGGEDGGLPSNPTFAISDKFLVGAYGLQHILFHKIASWKAVYSGSPVFIVDKESKKLIPIGMNLGGRGKVNGAILFNHPFIQNIIQQQPQETAATKKTEL